MKQNFICVLTLLRYIRNWITNSYPYCEIDSDCEIRYLYPLYILYTTILDTAIF